MSEPLLSLDRVSRHFGGVRAVDQVSFSVSEGIIHGLIGPNGAGKTTVLNLVSGLMPLTSGSITLAGQRIDRLPAHRIAAMGVRRTFQNIRLFPVMSALDNVVVGGHTLRRHGAIERILYRPAALREEQAVRARSAALLERVGLGARIEELARNLSYGEQRRLEIARALAGEPRLLLLDEPAAGMPYGEMMDLVALIRSIAAEGHTVLLIEHNMELVMNVCERITVLDFGRVIAEGTPSEISADPDVIAAYLGSEA
jgi:ABC-type branched-subunit amino acid transport system ATPase component